MSRFSEKKRIVVKVGSSILMHEKTQELDLNKLEILVRQICDIKNQGIDICLVSSGAIAVGRQMLGITKRPERIPEKQACASVGQASLMMTYQKLFLEYNHDCGQVLMTKYTMTDPVSRKNAENTFNEMFRMGIIPVVNENDTVSTYEIQFGDNDSLSALVASLVGADLLILLSDIDGLFTDDPRENPDAQLVTDVIEIDENLLHMAKDKAGSDVGTGGMMTKINAAKIATYSGADMVIANGADVHILHDILQDHFVGTHFHANKREDFFIADFIEENMQ